MDLQLHGKRCIVLGGSRGIGRSITSTLAHEGAHVAVCAREEGSLHEVAESVRSKGGTCVHQVCDVGDPAALAGFLNWARNTLGGLDVLIHNASAMAVGPELADWELSLRVDLMAAVHACHTVIPWMAEGGGGTILFVSSTSGLEADPSPNYAYTASKAGLIAYAKKLAVLAAPKRVRVNAIAPGSTEIPGGFWDVIRKEKPQIYASTKSRIPWDRMGTAQEIADVAIFLCSPRSSWVVGECVSVDGGQHRGMR